MKKNCYTGYTLCNNFSKFALFAYSAATSFRCGQWSLYVVGSLTMALLVIINVYDSVPVKELTNRSILIRLLIFRYSSTGDNFFGPPRIGLYVLITGPWPLSPAPWWLGSKIVTFECQMFVRRWSHRNFVTIFDARKTRMVELPVGEKFVDMYRPNSIC